MAKAIDEIKAELMELPRGEREDLAEFLIESLEREEVRSAWATEARLRYDEIRAGRRRTIGNDEAFARLRARFG